MLTSLEVLAVGAVGAVASVVSGSAVPSLFVSSCRPGADCEGFECRQGGRNASGSNAGGSNAAVQPGGQGQLSCGKRARLSRSRRLLPSRGKKRIEAEDRE